MGAIRRLLQTLKHHLSTGVGVPANLKLEALQCAPEARSRGPARISAAPALIAANPKRRHKAQLLLLPPELPAKHTKPGAP